MVRGSPTFQRMSSLLAPSAFSTSSSSGSVVAKPVAMLTTIGKKQIDNAVSTAGTEADSEHEADHGCRERLQDVRPQDREFLEQRDENLRRARQHEIGHACHQAE